MSGLIIPIVRASAPLYGKFGLCPSCAEAGALCSVNYDVGRMREDLMPVTFQVRRTWRRGTVKCSFGHCYEVRQLPAKAFLRLYGRLPGAPRPALTAADLTKLLRVAPHLVNQLTKVIDTKLRSGEVANTPEALLALVDQLLASTAIRRVDTAPAPRHPEDSTDS